MISQVFCHLPKKSMKEHGEQRERRKGSYQSWPVIEKRALQVKIQTCKESREFVLFFKPVCFPKEKPVKINRERFIFKNLETSK